MGYYRVDHGDVRDVGAKSYCCYFRQQRLIGDLRGKTRFRRMILSFMRDIERNLIWKILSVTFRE